MIECTEVQQDQKDEPKRTYPYIGEYTTDEGTSIVLFFSRANGVHLQAIPSLGLDGDTSDWAESLFTVKEGPITLQNKPKESK